jgi:pimeloyl-ACP methyl ester carboxylesterase
MAEVVAVLYFVLFALVICLRVLFRVVGALLRKLPNQSEADGLDVPSHIVVLIHGTWAGRSIWTLPGSPLRKSVQHALGAGVRFERMVWSGRNTFHARSTAANKLLALLSELGRCYSNVPVIIIAHSHGGNIAMQALTRLDPNIRVDGLLCLSTPFLIAEPRELGEIGHFATGVVPATLFWIGFSVIGQLLVQILFGTQIESDALFGVSGLVDYLPFAVFLVTTIASVFVWFLAKKHANATAKQLIEDLAYKVSPKTRVLILRTAGDEASSSLNAITLLSAIIERIYEIFASPFLEANKWLGDLTNRIMKRRWIVKALLWIVLALGFVLGSLALRFSEEIAASSQRAWLLDLAPFLRFVGLLCWAISLFTMALAYGQGIGAKVYKFMASTIAVIPLGICLAFFAVPLGIELALACLLLRVTAEPVPLGSHLVSMVPSTAEGEPPPSPVELKHSRTYEVPPALTAIEQWLQSHS